MSLLFPLFSVGATLVGAAFVVATAVVSALVGVLTWTGIYLSATLNALLTLASNKKLAAFVVLALGASIVVGPPLATDSNLVLKPLDFATEGLARVGLEVFSKLVVVNVRGAFDALAPAYNTIIDYLFVRFDIWFVDLKDVYAGIAATADYFRVLEIAKSTWDFAKSFVGYFWMTKSDGGKTEFFKELNPSAYFFEFIFSFPTMYETDPSYGAFPAVDTDGALYYLRNILLDFVEVVRGAGDIIFTKIAEFAFPGQKFFPSFYVRVEVRSSFWLQLSDWLTRVIEFATGSSFYPKEYTVQTLVSQGLAGQSVQPKRYEKTLYTARVVRIIAQIPRLISLLVFTSTTVRFPLPPNTPFGTGIEFIKNKLIGVPVVDLFLDPLLTAQNNVNTLSKNYEACFILRELYFVNFRYGPSSRQGALQCNAVGGIFKGTFPLTSTKPGCEFECCLWNGLDTPEESERIDFISEAYQIVPAIAQLIEDPDGVLTTARDAANDVRTRLIDPIVKIIYAYVYLVGTSIYPQCEASAANRLVAAFFNIYTVRILEYVYQPRTCQGGVIGPVSVDPLTCFITINSRSNGGGGFWGGICDLLDSSAQAVYFFENLPSLSSPPSFYNCDFKRKRNVASGEFKRKSRPPPFMHRLKMAGMVWASETRNALIAVQKCVFSPENSTLAHSAVAACGIDGCAVATCVDETLDCVASELPGTNVWNRWLGTKNNTNHLARNIFSFVLNAIDLLRGCSDSFVFRAYDALKENVTFMRSFFVRYLMVFSDYVPAYFSCMEKLRAATNHSTGADDDMAFAYCIGLTTKSPSAEGRRQPKYSERVNVTAEKSEPNEWQQTLIENGIFSNSSWCARRLHARGIVVDDVELTDSLSLDHVVHRICSFQLAFGTRATLAETTTVPLVDFLGGWTGPLALLSSMNSFGNQHMEKLTSDLPVVLPEMPIRRAPQSAQHSAPVSDQVSATVAALTELMPTIEIVASGFNYLADLHDHVGPSNLTPEEKEELDQRLLLHHLGLREQSMRKRAAFQFGSPLDNIDEEQALNSSLVAESATRKRNFANAALKMDSRISVFQEFGKQLYWAGQYPIATAMDEQLDAPFEFSIDQKLERYGAEPVLAMRTKHVDARTGLVLQTQESETLWHRLPVSDFEIVLDALRNELEGSPQQQQLLASAVAAYKGLRESLSPRNSYVQGSGNTHSGRASISYASTMITLLWRIINRRLRVEGLPAFHAASLVVDMFGRRRVELQYLPAWLNGRKAYLHGVGFVDNSVYEVYMRNEQSQRERAIALYSPSAYGEYDDVSLYSQKRARLLHAQMVLQRDQLAFDLALDEGTINIAAQRQAQSVLAKVLKRHVSFAQRSAFMVRHNLHGDDTVLHLVAPHWWKLRTMAAQANTTEARARFSISASLQSGDFLSSIDEFLELFGASPNLFETWLIALETSVVGFFSATSDPLYFANLKVALSNWWISVACDRVQDVRLTGTGSYKLLCFPYLWEKAFNWYEFFPKKRPGKGILGYFEGPGYIEWPTAMIDVACPAPRDPTLQCTVEPAPPFFLQANTTVALEDFETPNGASAPVFPVNTTRILGNICITDWCLVTTVGRPNCPTFDYCDQSYLPPDVFGFLTGGENLEVWLNDLRFVYARVTANDAFVSQRFWAILFLFLIVAFSDYFFIPFLLPSPLAGQLIAAIFIIIEFFVVQRPENYALLLIYFWIFLEFLPLAAWIQWAFYITHVFQLNYFGASFLQVVFDGVPSLFPDELLIRLLNFLGTLSFIDVIYDTTNFTNYATTIANTRATFVANELNNVMALISFWNVLLLLFEVFLVAYIAVYVAGAVLYFVAAFFPLLTLLSSLASSVAAFFTSLAVVGIANSVDDLEEEVDLQNVRLARESRFRNASQQQQIGELSQRIAGLERRPSSVK